MLIMILWWAVLSLSRGIETLEPEAAPVFDQGGECEGSTDGDECFISFRQLRGRQLTVQGARDLSSDRHAGALDSHKLGILNLDGYIYPTQPGDVNDLRTWCTVDPDDTDKLDYQCQQPLRPGEFGTEYAVLRGQGQADFTFAVSQMAQKTSYNGEFVPVLKQTIKYFMTHPQVAAVTCNVGFCAELQPLFQQATKELCAEHPNVRPKPALLGSPALLPAFSSFTHSPKLLLDPKKEKIIILTSYYPGLDRVNLRAILEASGARVGVLPEKMTHQEMAQMAMKHTGIECADDDSAACLSVLSRLAHTEKVMIMAKNILVIGWNKQEGYKAVDEGGAFHNVNLTLETYKPRVENAFQYLASKGFSVKAMILESTEMPAHANKIRMDFKVPVFDITTVGQCLMQAAPSYAEDHPAGAHSDPFVELFVNAAFVRCLEDRFAPSFIDPKFGTQRDGTLRFYEGLSQEEIDSLTCNGGRPPAKPPIGRLMENYDIGYPVKLGHLNPICFSTQLCQCPGQPKDGQSCPGLCPGSGNCGGGPFGPQLNPRVNGSGYPCGVVGELCSTLADVPRIGLRAGEDPGNSYACSAPVSAQGFKFGNFTS